MTSSGKATAPEEAQVSRSVLMAYEDIKPKVQQLQNSNAQSIMLRYEVGARLARFRAKPDTYEANLASLSQLMQKELGYHLAPPVLDSFVILVQMFPDEEGFRRVASRPMRNGDLLTWSHFRALFPLGPNCEKIRDQLLDQCCQGNWGYRELSRAVKAVMRPRKPGQGRKPRAPGTPMSAAQQISESLRSMLNRGPSWENVLGDGFREVADSMITDRMLSEFETLASLLDEGRQLLRRLHRSIQDAISQVRDILEKRRESATPSTKAAENGEATEVPLPSGERKAQAARRPARRVDKRDRGVSSAVASR